MTEESIQTGNLSVLKELHPVAYEAVCGPADDIIVEAVLTRDGDSVPRAVVEERKLFIHSRFNPVQEAKRFIDGVETDKHDLFVVIGFGFGFHVDELLSRAGTDSIILVIEKSSTVFKKALECRDISGILADRRLMLLISPDEETLSQSLRGKSSRNVSIITHRGSCSLYESYYGTLVEKIRSLISTKDVNIATLAKFEKIWSSNISRNIMRFMESPPVSIFYNRFKNIPAVVVGAGPSLNMSMEFLKAFRDRIIIIAVDTSFKMLRDNDIEPHFCMSVDPQLVNARYFEATAPGKTVLITEPVVHPAVFRFFGGRIVTAGIAFDIMKWIENHSGEKGEITHGGSVSTNAYDFAKRLGASPVYLLGQDLAFTWGLAHARGSYLDEQFHYKTNRIRNIQMLNRNQITALPKIEVKGIKTPTVITNQKLMIFLKWFEGRSDPALINLTYDGAYLNGAPHRETGSIEIADNQGDLSAKIDELYEKSGEPDGASGENIDSLSRKISGMEKDVDKLIPHLEKAVTFSENLMELVGKARPDQGKMNYTLKKLSEIDRIIESGKNISDMISLSIQRVIHTINEGYEIDDKDSELSEDELVAKKSHYLYSGLLEGAVFNRKILKNMNLALKN